MLQVINFFLFINFMIKAPTVSQLAHLQKKKAPMFSVTSIAYDIHPTKNVPSGVNVLSLATKLKTEVWREVKRPLVSTANNLNKKE